MKTIVYRFFVLMVTLFGVMGVFAASHPPSPGARTNNEPPPPGFPIDDDIFVLVIVAILFGIYIICRHQLKTKALI